MLHNSELYSRLSEFFVAKWCISTVDVFLIQAAFVADDVSNIIKESVDAVLQNQQYNENKVGGDCCTSSHLVCVALEYGSFTFM